MQKAFKAQVEENNCEFYCGYEIVKMENLFATLKSKSIKFAEDSVYREVFYHYLRRAGSQAGQG